MAIISVLSLLGFAACRSEVVPSQVTTIRIGWQTPWATQGQIAQCLNHTNALALNDLRAEFKGFTFGAPLNEAALAGEVDVIFTADQPAASLLAAGGRWKIIARLMYNRVAIYVPPDSPIRNVTDLKNKSIAMPFGAAAQREALKAVQAAGLDPAEDVKAINLDIYEQAGVINAGTRSSWGNIDAMAGFDPTPAIFQQQGVVRILHESTVVSVVMMSDEFIGKHPNAPTQFLKAFAESYYYYSQNVEQANTWFKEASRLEVDNRALALASSVEQNVQADRPEDLDFGLSDQDIARMQEGADFLVEQGLVQTRVEMADHVTKHYLDQALKQLKMNPEVFLQVRPQ